MAAPTPSQPRTQRTGGSIAPACEPGPATDGISERRSGVRGGRAARVAGIACRPIRRAVRRVHDVSPFWSQTAGIILALGVTFLALACIHAVRGASGADIEAFVVTGSLGLSISVSIMIAGSLLAGVGGAALFASTSTFTTAIAVGMFTTVPWDGRTGLAGCVLVPATVGSWFAMVWVRRLHGAGLRGAALVEATTTVRSLAFAWAAIMSSVVVVWTARECGADLSLDGMLGDGLTGLVGVAAVIAYAGRGYTEYCKGLAAAST